MKKVDFRRVFVVAGLAALVILYALLWVRMITSPAERTGTDFIAFYAAGRIVLSGDRAGVFDPHLQVIEEEKILVFPILPSDLNPFVHPPFILPILAVIALFPYVWAFHAWAILLFILYGVSALMLLRVIPQVKERKVLFFSIILFFPAFVSVLNGQDTALLLLGAALWLYGLLGGDDRLAGFGLAMTTIRPHIALLLALPFLFRRRKVWWWFLLGASILAVFSVLLVGIKGAGNFINILSISANGTGYKINELSMVNLLGLLRRLVPDIPPDYARLASWIIYACGIVFLCVVWARSESIEEKQIGLAALVALFASPHLHYHDLALLLIPIICVLALVTKKGYLDGRITILFLLAISWMMIASNSIFVLKFTLPYFLGAVLLIALWYPGVAHPRQGKTT